ncbi:rRNA methylase [methanotrophic bacterial endosymbiont of Bathymodiolus sp.]|nr:rRNA methylase [methanotrophic bacterial endosymbiont of Bathymodiolus sp.]
MLSTRFTLHSLVTEAQKTILPYLSDQSISIDATMGNGHDTLFLAKHSLKVYAFDIQENAINATRTRLEKNNCIANVSLILAGHETMSQHINPEEKADAILFNLGYLPHADTSIITQEKNTITALNYAINLLGAKGILSILAYPGHTGGSNEMQAVIHWYERLNSSDFAITIIHSMHEKTNSPRLFTLQKSQ